MLVDDLTGQDLVYWVSRGNDPADPNRLRRHYGTGAVKHLPSEEPNMRRFAHEKFGSALPARETWQ